MLNPASFDWAKCFLASPTWSFFAAHSETDFQFVLPQSCPTDNSPTCFSSKVDNTIAMVENMVNAELQDEDCEPITSSPISANDDTPSSEQDLSKLSPSSSPWAVTLLAKAGKLQLSEDDPTLRRSSRQKALRKGFKHMTCNDRHCVACEASPQPFHHPIKNLGATFCDIDPEKLTEEAMNKKKRTSAPGGKKKVIKKNGKGSDDADKDQASKKKAKK